MTHVRTLALRQVLQSPSSIPSPHQGVWQVGPFPVRAYALCILAGIVVALVVTNRRWRPRGGAGVVLDIAMWAVPFGIVGGRTYHVITDPELYFLPGRNPWNALKIWEGGLGIWGAVALGAVGAWIGPRRCPPVAVRRRRRPGHPGGAGLRPVGKLVQPGAVEAHARTSCRARGKRRASTPGHREPARCRPTGRAGSW